jgi:hypothetical protein
VLQLTDGELLVAAMAGATAIMIAMKPLRDRMQPHLDRMQRRLRAMNPAQRAALRAAILAIWCAPLFFIFPIRFVLALLSAYAIAFALLVVYWQIRIVLVLQDTDVEQASAQESTMI